MSKSDDKIVSLPSLEAIEAEAAAWLTVFGRTHVSSEELAKFKSWIGQSDRHRKAFNTLSALWGDLENLKALQDLEVVADPESVQREVITRRRLVAAAACVPVIVAGGMAAKFLRDKSLNQKAEFATKIGEQKTVKLADDSVIQLNTNSMVRVDYTETARNIRLLRGEAYFDVAKNPHRPFSVFASDGVVRAVGTAFTVRLRSDESLEVTVEEGRVALSSPSDAEPNATPNVDASIRTTTTELTASQSAVFTKRVEALSLIEQSELDQKLAWRQGLLAYAGIPLSEVVADVSRYTDISIEITDPELRNKPIGGVFRVGKLDALFDALHITFGLTIDRVNPKLIRISAAS